MEKEHLFIIGGGASGLMAANLLKDKMQVTIIEARNNLGGRMMTITDGKDIIEAGAEFIHGNAPLTMSLLTAAGIKPVSTGGSMMFSKKGQFLQPSNDKDRRQEMIKKALALAEDMTLREFLSQHYAGNDYADFREETCAYAEGFDLADPATVSVKSLALEWLTEEDNYRIPGGYISLVNYLEGELQKEGVKIITGVTIKQVDWQKGSIRMHDHDGRQYIGTKLLVTVPVSIAGLASAEASIKFSPEIDKWQDAASQIGFGAVIKIVLRFAVAFWPKDTGFVISDQPVRTWWTQFPDDSALLTGWCGGPAAEELGKLGDEFILQEGINSLSAIFSISAAQLRASLITYQIFDWCRDKFSLGGYSFSYPTSDASREMLNTAIDSIIYFAGEGMYKGAHPGTVEAAFETGRLAAGAIMTGC